MKLTISVLLFGAFLLSVPSTWADAPKPPETAKTHIAKHGISLDLPSAAWSEVGGNEAGDIHGLAVCRGDVWVTLLVEQLPGMSKEIVGNCTKDFPSGTKISKETITTLGSLAGTGTRFVAIMPDSGRMEYVLFFPKDRLSGYYLFTMLGGPPEPEYQADLVSIIQSLRKEK